MIPDPDMETGLLPAGIHQASFDDVRRVFVDEAPHPDIRRGILDALLVWCARARHYFGSGTIWLDGGFVTHKGLAPHDADIVFLPDDVDLFLQAYANSPEDVMGLLTLQNVMWASPFGGSCRRVQPMGGLIDAFVIDPRQPEYRAMWRETWSRVKLPDGTLSDTMQKGFLEVTI